jgi:dTDP-4-dehydrorhamnose 3,5-epimerase
MVFEAIEQPMDGLIVMYPKVFRDDRGYFLETFSNEDIHNIFSSHNLPTPNFVQENQSQSKLGVLRGLHLQLGDSSQGKLVRVTKGQVLDVAVDLRPDSPTFGQHYSIILDDLRQNMMYVPEGFAHGFITLEDNTIFTYKCTNYYDKSSECCIKYDDEELNIDWGRWDTIDKIVSEKDLEGITFKEYKEL